MTTIEIITVIIAVLALAVSILAFLDVKRIKNNITSVTANAHAIAEMTLNERITNTKERVSDIANIMIPIQSKSFLSDEEKRVLEGYTKQFNLSIENNLNAYELACANYIDDKIDKTRFKKLYKSEIKNLVEHANLKIYFDGVTSKHKAILKVYNEWENLEN